MNNEIKEILDNVKKCCDIMEDNNFVVYQKQDILKVLDYIINLQEKYERMKENANILSNGYDDLEKRNEKAIDYILKLDKDYDINVYQEDKHWAMVLYILQGEDKDDTNSR